MTTIPLVKFDQILNNLSPSITFMQIAKYYTCNLTWKLICEEHKSGCKLQVQKVAQSNMEMKRIESVLSYPCNELNLQICGGSVKLVIFS